MLAHFFQTTRQNGRRLSSLRSIFLFSGTIILMSIGYSATNPKKISFGKAFGTIVGVWLLYVIVKVGFTAAFS